MPFPFDLLARYFPWIAEAIRPPALEAWVSRFLAIERVGGGEVPLEDVYSEWNGDVDTLEAHFRLKVARVDDFAPAQHALASLDPIERQNALRMLTLLIDHPANAAAILTMMRQELAQDRPIPDPTHELTDMGELIRGSRKISTPDSIEWGVSTASFPAQVLFMVRHIARTFLEAEEPEGIACFRQAADLLEEVMRAAEDPTLRIIAANLLDEVIYQHQPAWLRSPWAPRIGLFAPKRSTPHAALAKWGAAESRLQHLFDLAVSPHTPLLLRRVAFSRLSGSVMTKTEAAQQQSRHATSIPPKGGVSRIRLTEKDYADRYDLPPEEDPLGFAVPVAWGQPEAVRVLQLALAILWEDPAATKWDHEDRVAVRPFLKTVCAFVLQYRRFLPPRDYTRLLELLQQALAFTQSAAYNDRPRLGWRYILYALWLELPKHVTAWNFVAAETLVLDLVRAASTLDVLWDACDWVKRIGCDTLWVRCLLQAQATFHPPSAETLAALREAAQTPSRRTRQEAVLALAALAQIEAAPTDVVPPLVAAAEDPDFWVQRIAVEALHALVGRVEDPSPVVTGLLTAGQSAHKPIRTIALRALRTQAGHITAPGPVVDFLLTTAQDPDDTITQAAVRVLAAVIDQLAITQPMGPLLLDALRKTPAESRVNGVYVLFKLLNQLADPTPVLHVSQEALTDEHWEVRQTIARLLGKIGEKLADPTPVVAPLLEAARDETPWVRDAAKWNLGVVGGRLPDPTPVVDFLWHAAHQEDGFKGELATTHEALVVLASQLADPTAALDIIRAVVQMDTVKAKEIAVWALRTINWEPEHAAMVEQILQQAVTDGASQVRNAVAEMLQAVLADDPKEVRGPFTTSQENSDIWFDNVFLVIHALQILVADETSWIRSSAMAALENLERRLQEPTLLVPALLVAVQEEDEGVRKPAAKMLGTVSIHLENPKPILFALLNVLTEWKIESKALVVLLNALIEHLKDPIQVTPILLAAVNDKSYWVREATVRALYTLVGLLEEPIPLLSAFLTALKSDEVGARFWIRETLERLEEKEPTLIVGVLMVGVRDKNWEVANVLRRVKEVMALCEEFVKGQQNN